MHSVHLIREAISGLPISHGGHVGEKFLERPIALFTVATDWAAMSSDQCVCCVRGLVKRRRARVNSLRDGTLWYSIS